MYSLTTTPKGYAAFLRFAIGVQTLSAIIAPITAGVLLTAPSGRTLHSAAAYTVFTVALVHLVAAIAVWRPGGGPAKPIGYASGFLAATLLQVAAGIAGVMTVHVPLGVLMFGVSLLQLTQVRSAARPAGR